MSKADQQLRQLRQEGRLEVQGEFVLDPEKAREKLSKYQLEDPHFYVLELVQAAHLLGATKIEVEQDADELEMRFDGRALEEEQLEDIFSFAFQRSKSPDLLALRHLAIALQCAQALGPKHLWFERVDKDQAVRLIVDERELQLQAFTPELEIKRAHYRFYLRERPRFLHLMEFFEAREGVQVERIVIKKRCTHSRATITLNGKTISHTGWWDTHETPALRVEGENLRALLRPVSDGPEEPGQIWLRNGVFFERSPLPIASMSERDLLLIVDAGDLNLDLARAKIVRDAQWERAQRACRSLIYERFCDQWEHVLKPAGRALSKESHLLAAALADCRQAGDDEDMFWTQKLVELFAAEPVLLSAREHQARGWSIAQLRAVHGEDGKLPFTTQQYVLTDEMAQGVVCRQQEIELEDLADYLGLELEGCDEQLAAKSRKLLKLEDLQRAFEQREVRKDIPGGPRDPASASHETEHGTVSWAFSKEAQHHGQFRIIVFAQRRCLRTMHRTVDADSYLAGLCLRLSSETLPVNDQFVDFEHSESYRDLFVAAYQLLPEALLGIEATFLRRESRAQGIDFLLDKLQRHQQVVENQFALRWCHAKLEGRADRIYRRALPESLRPPYSPLEPSLEEQPHPRVPTTALPVEIGRLLDEDYPEDYRDPNPEIWQRLSLLGEYAEMLYLRDVQGTSWSLLELASKLVLTCDPSRRRYHLTRADEYPEVVILPLPGREARLLRQMFVYNVLPARPLFKALERNEERLKSHQNQPRLHAPIQRNRKHQHFLEFGTQWGEGSWGLTSGSHVFNWRFSRQSRVFAEDSVLPRGSTNGFLRGLTLQLHSSTLDLRADCAFFRTDARTLSFLAEALDQLPRLYGLALQQSDEIRKLESRLQWFLRAWCEDRIPEQIARCLEVPALAEARMQPPKSEAGWRNLRHGLNLSEEDPFEAHRDAVEMRIAAQLHYKNREGGTSNLLDVLDGAILSHSLSPIHLRRLRAAGHQAPVLSVSARQEEFLCWVLGQRAQRYADLSLEPARSAKEPGPEADAAETDAAETDAREDPPLTREGELTADFLDSLPAGAAPGLQKLLDHWASDPEKNDPELARQARRYLLLAKQHADGQPSWRRALGALLHAPIFFDHRGDGWSLHQLEQLDDPLHYSDAFHAGPPSLSTPILLAPDAQELELLEALLERELVGPLEEAAPHTTSTTTPEVDALELLGLQVQLYLSEEAGVFEMLSEQQLLVFEEHPLLRHALERSNDTMAARFLRSCLEGTGFAPLLEGSG